MNFSGTSDCQPVLDPDQAGHFDGPDLDPNSLQTVTRRYRVNMVPIFLLNYR